MAVNTNLAAAATNDAAAIVNSASDPAEELANQPAVASEGEQSGNDPNDGAPAAGEGDQGDGAEGNPEGGSEGEGSGSDIPEGDPEPDGSDPVAWSAWRIRESNRIAIRQQEIEDSAAIRAAQADPDAATQANASDAPSGDGAAVAEPHALVARYDAIKAAVEAARTTHDWGDGTAPGYQPSPGEEQLMEFTGELVRTHAQTEARLSQMEAFFMAQQTRSIHSMASTAATKFQEAWGVPITPNALMGMAQNGGAAAWAALKGIPAHEVLLHLTPEAFVEIAQAKLGSKLQGKAPAAAATPTRGKPLPSVNAGGASVPAKPESEMTDQEISRRARMEARAAQGVN